MTDSNLENLIDKYFEGTIDDEQFKLLGNWLATKSDASESYIAKAMMDAMMYDQFPSASASESESLSRTSSLTQVVPSATTSASS